MCILYLCLPISLHVFCKNYLHVLCTCEYERCHLGPIWCRASTSWQSRACLCFSCCVSACESDWVGVRVGARMFNSCLCVCVKAVSFFTLQLPLWQYTSPKRASCPFPPPVSISQHLCGLPPSRPPPSSHFLLLFFPYCLLKWKDTMGSIDMLNVTFLWRVNLSNWQCRKEKC